MLTHFKTLNASDPAAANRLLLSWLSDDASRAELYRELSAGDGVLAFETAVDTVAWLPTQLDAENRKPTRTAYLLTDPQAVNDALRPTDDYSNAPFRALGSGSFMLGLDAGHEHDEQRKFAKHCFSHITPDQMLGLVTAAFQAGALLGLKRNQFDLADVAEQVALRYMGLMFGFAQSDHVLLERSMRRAYRGLCYQVLGRHFVCEPATVIEAGNGMAELLKRVQELIGIYQAERRREGVDKDLTCSRCHRKGHRGGIDCAQYDEADKLTREHEELGKFILPGDIKTPLQDFEPVLRRIAASTHGFSSTQAAAVVVGLIAGAIGNMQASICIAVREILALDAVPLRDAGDAARAAYAQSRAAADDDTFTAWVWETLRRNPPVAFLPRETRQDMEIATPAGPYKIPARSLVVLAMGAAMRQASKGAEEVFVPPASGAMPGPGCPMRGKVAADATVFGGDNRARQSNLHACVGQAYSMPLIVHVVRQVMVLPGLTQSLDIRTGYPVGLRKLWGYGCDSYPMEFRREGILKQSPLSVVMRIKTPTPLHAESLKIVIKSGAPSIEKRLNDARHVHFAWFHFLENDTQLALFTVYDRDFDSYIEHFALEIGPLFDRIFEHIEDAPPLPVNEFPKEFVDTIRRFNRVPAAGYFYSAYPNAEAATLSDAYKRKYP